MKTILVADDDPVIQRLLSYILEQAGYLVVLAWDGMEALEALESQKVDLVLLDLDMPRLNGLEVLTRIREHQAHFNIPVVILTASGQEADAERAWTAGVSQLLTKPIGSRALLGAVGRLLE